MSKPMQEKNRNLPSPDSYARRQFLGLAGSSVGFAIFGGLTGCGGGGGGDSDSVPTSVWDSTGAAGKIISSLQNVAQGSFKKVDYDVVTYGAAKCAVVSQSNPYSSPLSTNADKTHAPGSFDCRPAILAAIKACSDAGGGRVVIPSGDWYCAGPIVLKSNVNLHLSADCTIYFSNDPADYAKDGPYDCGSNGKLYYTRWQCDDCLNYGSPIYAINEKNIAITGEDPKTSILNGQGMKPFAGSGNTATCWWTWKGNKGMYGCVDSTTPSCASVNTLNVDLMTVRPTLDPALYALLTNPITPWQQDQNYLPALSEAGVPVVRRIFGKGHYLRPCMVVFINCTNVLMEGYQTNNTPFWQHHPIGCTNVVIRNVITDSIGLNNDGFDPDGCNTVLCDGVVFNTGDDCIAVKSGKNLDTQYGPGLNHVFQNCTMNSGHGGITFGSEMGAGLQYMYARNLTMLNKFWETDSLNMAIRFKTNMNRGGYVKDVYIDGVSLPNGVSLSGKGYGSSMLPGSPISQAVPVGVATAAASNPAASQGGVIAFDCDYQPAKDAIRTRAPVIQNVHISNVQVGNVTLGSQTGSCFQAIVAQGPVAFDYNGPAPAPTVLPISNVTVTNCNFGTPTAAGPAGATVPGPIYAFNVKDITLNNVLIAGIAYNTIISDKR